MLCVAGQLPTQTWDTTGCMQSPHHSHILQLASEPLHIEDSQGAQNLHACTPGDDSEHSVVNRPSQAQEGGC